MLPTESLQTICDPLNQTVDLPLEVTLYPIGFPLRLATNSADVVACARRSWGYFPRRFDADAVRLRIVIENGTAAAGTPVYRAQGNLFSIIGSADNFAVCDLSQGFGFGCFTSAAAACSSSLSFYFLEAMVYACLTHLHLTAVHAACVAFDGRGVLLCGDSGAGKSCLAYACARSGFTFVSDDSTALLRASRGRQVIGKPGFIRLRDTAVEVLPEINGNVCGRSPGGKPTIEISTADVPGLRSDFECRADYVVFLSRGRTSGASLHPVPREEVRRRLEEQMPVLESGSHMEQIASLDRLLDCELLELRYQDLGSAVQRLRQLVLGGR